MDKASLDSFEVRAPLNVEGRSLQYFSLPRFSESARVVLQDFTGVPAVVDLAAMRDAVAEMGGDPSKINPLFPSELVIDHSVQVDAFGSRDAFSINARLEFHRNRERYQ